MLERFYTDLAGNSGLGRWLVKCGPLLGLKDDAARLASRRLPDSIKAKTVTFGWPSLRFIFNRRRNSEGAAARFREQLRWNGLLGLAMVERGFGDATHVYTMLGEFGPVLNAARQRGLATVTEIYISLSTERILIQEQKSFSGWEQTPVDLESVRREFPNETGLLSNTNIAVCPSEVVRRDLVDNFRFSPARSVVVPYGVAPCWLTLQTNPVPGRVLFVGTAGLRKGIQYLAMSAKRLRGRARRYEFRIAGEATAQTANQTLCESLTFLGRVARDRVHGEYASADVFVLPTLAEGSAEATYEALAAGVPVVTTAAAGSVVRNEIEGFIVPERDSVALATAIERVVESRRLRSAMSLAARERARDYVLERYGERLVNALHSFQE
jgi:hypothetical protein